MPSWRDFYGSEYLKADDLGEQEHTVTIQSVELRKMKDGRDRICLRLDKWEDSWLSLNTINCERLEKLYGENFAKWEGKKITLYVDDEVMMNGKVSPGIRIRLQGKGK